METLPASESKWWGLKEEEGVPLSFSWVIGLNFVITGYHSRYNSTWVEG